MGASVSGMVITESIAPNARAIRPGFETVSKQNAVIHIESFHE